MTFTMSSPSTVSQGNDSLITGQESDTTASSFSSQSTSQKPRYKSSYPPSWKLQSSKTSSGGPAIPAVLSKQNIAASNYNAYETLGGYGPSFPKEQPRYGQYGAVADNPHGAYPGEDPREYLNRQDYIKPAQFPQHPVGHPPNDPPAFRNYNQDNYPPYPSAPTYAPGYPPQYFPPVPKPSTNPYYNQYDSELVDRTASKRSDGYDAPHNQTSATSGYSTGPISGNSAAYNSAASRGSYSHDVPYTGITNSSSYSAGAVVSNQNSAAAMPSIGEA